VVSNADPKRLLGMLAEADGAVPVAYRRRLEQWDVSSPVVKLNVAMDAVPEFKAAGDIDPYRAMVCISPSIERQQAACEAARRGEPAFGFCELYFQSAYDPSVAPPGHHVMSVFAQHVPYELAEGTWDSRRDEVRDLILDAIEVHAPNVRDCIVEVQTLGPPDIEERIGLTGGHIFQGQALPGQMWDRRLEARTPVEGLYLCGAATHPGGSVIGLNGRIAADQVLTAG
jgi:phytoene dehydrogenase-like protein